LNEERKSSLLEKTKKLPGKIKGVSFCTNCNSFHYLDELAAFYLFLISRNDEKEIIKVWNSKSWGKDYYLETDFCANCESKEKNVIIKRINV
jgi:hypothetical protein